MYFTWITYVSLLLKMMKRVSDMDSSIETRGIRVRKGENLKKIEGI